MEDAKSNSLYLSKDTTQFILRSSMVEEPKEHGKMTFLQEYFFIILSSSIQFYEMAIKI